MKGKRYYSTVEEWNDAVDAGKVTSMKDQIKRIKDLYDLMLFQREEHFQKGLSEESALWSKKDLKHQLKLLKIREKRFEKGYK